MNTPTENGLSADAIGLTASLRLWHTGKNSDIRYIRVENDVAEAVSAHAMVRRLELGRRGAFGAVKVDAAIGDSHWPTSLFPQKDGSWYLPVKKAIWRAEGLEVGDEVVVRLELL